MLKRASVIAKSMTVFMTIALLVLWPIPMYGSSYGKSSERAPPPQVCFRSVRHVLEWTAKETSYKSMLPINETLTPESRLVFSRKFFTGWVVVGILWLFCSAFVSFYWSFYMRVFTQTLSSASGFTLYGRDVIVSNASISLYFYY